MKTDKEIYDATSPEAKRRLTCEIMGFKVYYHSVFNRLMIESKLNPCWSDVDLNTFKPDESLEQCRLLENKAKENGEVWSKYGHSLYCHLWIFNKEIPNFNMAWLANLTAYEKLFCLFQAFGVMYKLRKEKEDE